MGLRFKLIIKLRFAGRPRKNRNDHVAYKSGQLDYVIFFHANTNRRCVAGSTKQMKLKQKDAARKKCESKIMAICDKIQTIRVSSI